jgi:hypothetical protein
MAAEVAERPRAEHLVAEVKAAAIRACIEGGTEIAELAQTSRRAFQGAFIAERPSRDDIGKTVPHDGVP